MQFSLVDIQFRFVAVLMCSEIVSSRGRLCCLSGFQQYCSPGRFSPRHSNLDQVVYTARVFAVKCCFAISDNSGS